MNNEQKSEEKTEGAEKKTADDSSKNGVSAKVDEESPIQEARRILDETKEYHKKIEEERKRLEKIEGDRILGGRSSGKTIEEKKENPAQKMADEMVKAFR